MTASWLPASGRTAIAVAAMLVAMGGTGIAYEPDEVRAILLHRPTPPPPSAERVGLASQRLISIRSNGSTRTREHLLIMAGGALRGDSIDARWTFRPGLDRIQIPVCLLHRSDGSTIHPPSPAGRETACEAGGADGYPDLADFVVTVPGVSPGDVVEIVLLAETERLYRVNYTCGEHRFSGADSLIESWLSIELPSVLPFLHWRRGDAPKPAERLRGGLAIADWITGNLPAGKAETRTPTHSLSPAVGDSASEGPVLWWAFDCGWEEIVGSRGWYWRQSLRQDSPELASVVARIQAETPDPLAREEAAVAWVENRLEAIEIPATRLWFEPAEPEAILKRGAAIRRDRALILVWLLRRMGIPAEAATVGGRAPLKIEAAFPQQLDTWLVRSGAVPGKSRWIGLSRPPSSLSPAPAPPAGPALLWTAQEGGEIIVPFEGRFDR